MLSTPDKGRVPILRLSDIIGDDVGGNTTDTNSDTAVTDTMWRTTPTIPQQNTPADTHTSAPAGIGAHPVHDAILDEGGVLEKSAHNKTPEEPIPTHHFRNTLLPKPENFPHDTTTPSAVGVTENPLQNKKQDVLTHTLQPSTISKNFLTTNSSLSESTSLHTNQTQTDLEIPIPAPKNTPHRFIETSTPTETVATPPAPRTWQEHVSPPAPPPVNVDPLDIWEQAKEHTSHATNASTHEASVEQSSLSKPDPEQAPQTTPTESLTKTQSVDLENILTGFYTIESGTPENESPNEKISPLNGAVESVQNKTTFLSKTYTAIPPTPPTTPTPSEASGVTDIGAEKVSTVAVPVPDIWDTLESKAPHQQIAEPPRPPVTFANDIAPEEPSVEPVKKLGEDVPDMWANEKKATLLTEVPHKETPTELIRDTPIIQPTEATSHVQTPIPDTDSQKPPIVSDHTQADGISLPTAQPGVSNLATLRARILKGSLGKPGDSDAIPLPQKTSDTDLGPRFQGVARTDLQALQQATSLLAPDTEPIPIFQNSMTQRVPEISPMTPGNESVGMGTGITQTAQQHESFSDTVLHETIPQTEYTLPLMRTFKQDIEGTLHKNTLAESALLSPKSAPPMHRGASTQPRKSKYQLTPVAYLLMGASVAFLLGGVFLSIMYFIPRATTEEVSRYFVPEKKTHYDATSKGHEAIMQELAGIRTSTAERPHSVVQVVISEKILLPISKKEEDVPFTPAKLFAQEDTKMPQTLASSLENEFMLGFHQGTVAEPFIIMETNYFEGAFSGMLEWERDMPNDLNPLFPTKHTTTTPAPDSTKTQTATYTTGDSSNNSSTVSKFEDITVSNTPARALRNDAGEMVLVWSMPDNRIIISTNTDTLKEVYDRLQARTK
ncbi:MAG: hypothetical protein KBD24_01770 [Candidatus Pacebacteria bacterium]|nr:hypothetical protein [Candidatus Paceibacterota bacterium]